MWRLGHGLHQLCPGGRSKIKVVAQIEPARELFFKSSHLLVGGLQTVLHMDILGSGYQPQRADRLGIPRNTVPRLNSNSSCLLPHKIPLVVLLGVTPIVKCRFILDICPTLLLPLQKTTTKNGSCCKKSHEPVLVCIYALMRKVFFAHA